METATHEEYLSYSQVQERYGIGRTLAWKLIAAGEIEASRVGEPGAKRRTVRIKARSVQDYLNRHSYMEGGGDMR